MIRLIGRAGELLYIRSGRSTNDGVYEWSIIKSEVFWSNMRGIEEGIKAVRENHEPKVIFGDVMF